MRIGLISYNARQGDAIGNQVAEKARFFLQRGGAVRVFVHDGQLLHPDLAGRCTLVKDATAHGEPWDYLQSCDLVIAEYGQYYPLLDLLPLLAEAEPRIIIDYHGVTPPELWGAHNAENLTRGVARRGLLWCADGVIVHSWFTYNELVKELRIPTERILRWAYPIEIPQEAKTRTEQNWRQALGLQDAQVLLYVGRLAANKNVPLLVEALHHLRDLRPEVHLVIAGDDQDVYQTEADRCRRLAQELGVADRVHLLGPLVGERLYDTYRSADLFVTASAWESFCIPVIEAMAFGLPVVAARATALPDTVGDAGLTFAAGDARDLARTLSRVLLREEVRRFRGSTQIGDLRTAKRIAVIDGNPNHTTINGLSRSLKTIAASLRPSGHEVQYLNESSTSVLACGEEFDVLIVGPYLSETTFAVAQKWPAKTLLVPCFHDEMPARLNRWRKVYEQVAGFLYHSEEEQTLAQAELGYNHPNAVVIGTFLPTVRDGATPAQAERRTLVYCGRYLAEKNLPLLLDFARRYSTAHPGRFQFVFMGEGQIPIPKESWATNLGVVTEEKKAQLLAAANAMISLSVNESLSLAALEAWQQGTPVIAHARCAVVRGHIERSGGGAAVHDYAAFEKTLHDLWEKPEVWQQAGEKGRQYVRDNYEQEEVFSARLSQAVSALEKPLYEQMREKGIARANRFSRQAWTERLAAFLERVMHAEKQNTELLVEVRRRVAAQSALIDSERVFLPVLVCNWGTVPALAEGPARVQLCAQVVDEATGEAVTAVETTPMPRQLLPGEKAPAVAAVSVPERAGRFLVHLWAEREGKKSGAFSPPVRLTVADEPYKLDTPAGGDGEMGRWGDGENPSPSLGDGRSPSPHLPISLAGASGLCSALLANARLDLDEAERLQRLPDDYLDITQGALAKVKQTIKAKLLNNFKVAYVDVLSQQQSAFNRQMLSVVEELIRCCEMLDHAVNVLHRRCNQSRPDTPAPAQTDDAESPEDRKPSTAPLP